MRAVFFSVALAALCASSSAWSIPAEQVRLGQPLTLEETPASPSHDVEEHGEVANALQETETVPGAPDRASVENQRLGQPQKLLGPSASGGDPLDIDAADARSRLFGHVRGDTLQVISALAIVLGLVFTIRTVLLRGGRMFSGGGRPSGVLEVLARYPVARGQHLVILKIARRILLVHQNGETMSTLSEVHDPDEVASILGRIQAGASSPREASRFRSLLTQFSNEHDRAVAARDQSGIKDAWNEGEVVDLTRKSGRGVAGIFGRPDRRAGQ